MTDPRKIAIADYTYTLPEEKIAAYPLPERDASKLLIYKDGHITEDIYRNISSRIPENTLLVFNDTKVIAARLLFQKSTGGVIEIFCLEPHEQYADITSAMRQKRKVWWYCLVGGASKWKPGQVLVKKLNKSGQTITLQARYLEKRSGSFIIELSWSPSEISFAGILQETGAVPLPPYIKRAAAASDKDRYQTVFAHADGSVAAPTAGLHFTDRIFKDLGKKNIKTDFVTLHVGAGTFQPVKSEFMEEHEMHAEWIDIKKSAIENLVSNLDNDIIAVGTTSLRTMESLYWMGVKSLEPGLPAEALAKAGVGSSACPPKPQRRRESAPDSNSVRGNMPLELKQWEAYELAKKNIPVKEALQSLLQWMDRHQTERLITKTQILIAPGYPFKIVKGLVTNFHQPHSTLLLLVAALIGGDWRKVYEFALRHGYRFLSYGDGCLLWRKAD